MLEGILSGKGGISSRNFYKTFRIIGIPLIIQQFLTSALNFLDNIMLGKLGKDYIAGVGFANSVYRIQDIGVYGVCAGIGVFIAQYYGKKDYVTIKKLFGLMIVSAVLISIIIVAVSHVFTIEIISLFSTEAGSNSIKIGVSYLKISSLSYIVASIAFAMAFTLRCTGKTNIPMISAFFGIVINGILNYILIYGNSNLGIPPLLEKGAALATIVSRIVQLLVIFYFIYKFDYGIRGKLKEYFGISKDFFINILKISIPIFLTDMFWVLGTFILTIAFSRLGTTEAASVQIADLVFSIAAIVFLGVSNATAVIIGKSIGEGQKILAKHYAGKALKMAILFSFITFLFLQIGTNFILSFYKLTPEEYKIAIYTLRVYNFIIFFKLLNWTILIGILRAGGDTKVAFYLDVFPLYLFAIPLAFICLYLKLPIYVAVGVANFEEVIKFIFSLKRYFSMRWIKDLTEEN